MAKKPTWNYWFTVKLSKIQKIYTKYKRYFINSIPRKIKEVLLERNYSETSPTHLLVFKNLSVERCPLLEGNLKKINTFGTQRFVRYSWHVRCWEVSLHLVLLFKFYSLDKNSNVWIDRLYKTNYMYKQSYQHSNN